VAKVNAVPKAPIDVAKQIAPEAINPGFRAGMMTSITILNGGAPKDFAASSRDLSSFSAAAIIVSITLGIEKYKYPKNKPNIEYAKIVFSPKKALVMDPINPCRPANIIIKKPITTPGKARGNVRIDKTISLPGKVFLTRNNPAAVEMTKAVNVTVIESIKVAIILSKCLGVFNIVKYDEIPESLLAPTIDN
tara:strand:- start:14 stop:589 length:576 start_codon:yes stop_codon:yes gene_type:complete